MASTNSAITPPDLARWKQEGRKVSMLTAYDYPTARLLDDAGVDCLLVGDTVGMVVQGHSTTLRVTMDQMVYHVEMVARAARRALVVADMPYLSYQVSPAQAIESAGRFLKETECRAVKLEGGRALCRHHSCPGRGRRAGGRPYRAHPQSVRRLGGFKVQRDIDEILADARAVADAGAFALVLECIPSELAAQITRELPIVTIGIGAGPHCDGQVLVTPDLVGLFEGFRPSSFDAMLNLATRFAKPPPITSLTSPPEHSPTNKRVSVRLPHIRVEKRHEHIER